MSSLIVASVLRNKKLVFSYWTWQPCTNNCTECPVDQAAGIRKGGGPGKGQECWEMACTHTCACYTGAGVMVRGAMMHSSCGDVGSSVSVANSSPLAQRSYKYELFLWVSQHQLRLILNTSGQAKHICRPELAHRSGSQTVQSCRKKSLTCWRLG